MTTSIARQNAIAFFNPYANPQIGKNGQFEKNEEQKIGNTNVNKIGTGRIDGNNGQQGAVGAFVGALQGLGLVQRLDKIDTINHPVMQNAERGNKLDIFA